MIRLYGFLTVVALALLLSGCVYEVHHDTRVQHESDYIKVWPSYPVVQQGRHWLYHDPQTGKLLHTSSKKLRKMIRVPRRYSQPRDFRSDRTYHQILQDRDRQGPLRIEIRRPTKKQKLKQKKEQLKKWERDLREREAELSERDGHRGRDRDREDKHSRQRTRIRDWGSDSDWRRYRY